MNTLYIVVLAVIVIYVAYNFYALRIDRDIIQADAKRATPSKLYINGVDFMPPAATCCMVTTSNPSRPRARSSGPSRPRTSEAGHRR